jgi:hypothetical protein
MAMYTENEILPAYWASALINGDTSGLEDDEEAELDAWIAAHPYYGACLGCYEHTYLTQYEGLLTECLDYTFPVRLTEMRGDLDYLIYPAHKFDQPMPHHKAGLPYMATSYGKKIPTQHVIYLFGHRYRIYCTVFSNIGTCYINLQGRKVIVE